MPDLAGLWLEALQITNTDSDEEAAIIESAGCSFMNPGHDSGRLYSLS